MDEPTPTRLCRIIRRGLWPDCVDNIDECAEKLKLSTILEDFRSSRRDDKISFWDLESPMDVVLGIISKQYSDVDDLFVVQLNAQQIMGDAGVVLANRDGNSVFSWLNKSHYDLENANYQNMGVVIKGILGAIKNDMCYHITKRDIENSVRQLVGDGKISCKKLPKCLQAVVGDDAQAL